MLLTAREDYPDPGKRRVSATFNHQIGFLFQGGVIRESGSSGCAPRWSMCWELCEWVSGVAERGFPKCRCPGRWGVDCRHLSRSVSRQWPGSHGRRGQCLGTCGVWSSGLTADVGMWSFLPLSFLWSRADK